jgi:hypothetical protein
MSAASPSVKAAVSETLFGIQFSSPRLLNKYLFSRPIHCSGSHLSGTAAISSFCKAASTGIQASVPVLRCEESSPQVIDSDHVTSQHVTTAHSLPPPTRQCGSNVCTLDRYNIISPKVLNSDALLELRGMVLRFHLTKQCIVLADFVS